jgi:hypothetical protein
VPCNYLTSTYVLCVFLWGETPRKTGIPNLRTFDLIAYLIGNFFETSPENSRKRSNHPHVVGKRQRRNGQTTLNIPTTYRGKGCRQNGRSRSVQRPEGRCFTAPPFPRNVSGQHIVVIGTERLVPHSPSTLHAPINLHLQPTHPPTHNPHSIWFCDNPTRATSFDGAIPFAGGISHCHSAG